MAQVSCNSPYDYYRFIKHDTRGNELASFIDSLTVNETFFFRNAPQLRSFAEDVLQEILERKRKEGVSGV